MPARAAKNAGVLYGYVIHGFLQGTLLHSSITHAFLLDMLNLGAGAVLAQPQFTTQPTI